MCKFKFIIYLSLIIVFLSTSITYPKEYQKNNFNISLPPQWIEMPREIIDAQEAAAAKSAPDFPLQHYDYGFQLESSKNWFEFPYILIQVKNSGRIPENQLQKFEQISLQKDLKVFESQSNSIMSDIQAGKMFYDKQNKIIWMRIEGNVANVGSMAGLSCMVPTEKGFIQISGYSFKSDYPTYEPIFRSIAISTTPEADLLYKPNWTDHTPSVVRGIDWDKVIGKAIIGAVISGIIGLFSYFRRKKKN